MTKPFQGTINIDDRDSVPDWEPYLQPVAPEGAPNVLYIVLDDVGFSAMEPWGGLIETPNINRLAATGLTYTNWHTTALCSPTRSSLLTGRNHTTNGMACIAEATSGLPERERPHPVRVRDDRRGARRARLEHLHARQVAPRGRRRDEHGVDEAQLAGRPRLRALLRLPRRRDQPVVSRPGLRQPPGRPAGDAGGRLPPHDRPDRQGDRVHQGREGDRARQAVLHVLLPRRDPRPAPRPEGVDREVQGQVRHGLRAVPRAGLRAAEADGDLPRGRGADAAQPLRRGDERRRQAVEPGRRRPAVGLALGRREAAVLPHGRGVRRLPLAHRPRDRPPARLPRGVGSAREHDRRPRLRQRRQRRGRARTARSTRTSSSTASPTTSRRTCSTSTSSARPRPTTTTRWAGPGRSTRRSRCGSATTSRAASPTRWSSRGRRASSAPGELRHQFLHATDVVPTMYDLLGDRAARRS